MATIGHIITGGEATSLGVATDNRAQADDFLIDTATGTSNGNSIVYTGDIGTELAGIRAGGNVWIDTNALGVCAAIGLTRDTPGTTYETPGSVPLVFRPAYTNGQRLEIAGDAGVTSQFNLTGVSHWECRSEHSLFPGLRAGQTQANVKNQFGWWINRKFDTANGNHFGFITGVLADDGFDSGFISGIFAEHNFTPFRVGVGNQGVSYDLGMYGCIGLQSISELLLYLNMTSGSPVPQCKLDLRNCYAVCGGSEGIQLQHLQTGSVIENFVVYQPAMAWQNNFQASQDYGFQKLAKDGNVVVRNGIIRGGAQGSIIVFGDSTLTPAAGEDKIEKVLFESGRNNTMFGLGGSSGGILHTYKHLYVRDTNETYDETGATLNTNTFDVASGTDTHEFFNIIHDGVKASVFNGSDESLIVTEDATLPASEFIIDPFKDISPDKVKGYWKETYGTYLPNSGVTINYSIGDIVCDETNMKWFHAITNHAATASTPKDDATNWAAFQWDATGKHTLLAGFAAGSAQDEMLFNFGLVADNFWNKLGFGFGNEDNTDRVNIHYYVADDDSGTNSFQIPTPNKKTITIADHPQLESGKYIRVGFKDVGKAEVYGDWTLIP